MNENWLFGFGGYEGEGVTLSTAIERMNLQTRDKWQLLTVKIPTPLAQVGVYMDDSNKIYLFGGFN